MQSVPYLPATSNACVVLGLLYVCQAVAVIYTRLMTNRVNVGIPDISAPKSDIKAEAMKSGGRLFYFIVLPFCLWVEKVHGASSVSGLRDPEKDVVLLARVQRAQQNTAEYLPLFLILLLVRELQLSADSSATSTDKNMLQVLVWLFFAFRLVHFLGVALNEAMSLGRFLGISGTIGTLAFTALLCTGGANFEFA